MRNGCLFRQINDEGRDDFIFLTESGLYEKLAASEQLIQHTVVSDPPVSKKGWKIIRPELIPFVSHPWEWGVETLHDAALCTLSICRTALHYGMVLKDASAFNIQFRGVRPVCIDTLSFTHYNEGEPWIAYGQFCSNFLGPLLCATRRDIRLLQLFKGYINGIPLDLAAKLAPWSSLISPSLLMHIHLHARLQRLNSRRCQKKRNISGKFSKNAMYGLLDSLEHAVMHCRVKQKRSTWSDYYRGYNNYSAEAFSEKKKIVRDMLGTVQPATVWDIGANDGVFSKIAVEYARRVIAFDSDYEVINRLYQQCKKLNNYTILPLVTDLTNPSASCGWAHRERSSLARRGPVDCVMALALIHHLVIGNNVPLRDVADYFALLTNSLIVEFVSKQDSQVRRMLATRNDIFDDYTERGFEEAFLAFFTIVRKQEITGTSRTLYLMNKRIGNSQNNES
jgi:hypothetical protein